MNVPSGEKNGESAVARLLEARRRAGYDRRHGLSLVGSVLAGVCVGTLFWYGGSRNHPSRDVLEHLADGHVAAAVPGATDPDAIGVLLEPVGARLRPGAATLVTADRCRLRDRLVPHLQFDTGAGRVSVLLLPDDPVDEPTEFTGRGFSGRIAPFGSGSIIVAGPTGPGAAAAVDRVMQAVERNDASTQ